MSDQIAIHAHGARDGSPCFDTFLVDAPAGLAGASAPAALRPGMPVTLRAVAGRGWPRFDVWCGAGKRLGRLPPADAATLGTVSGQGRTLSGEISALVPTRLGSRIHLRIALPEAA
ncbi:hypothetical protein M0638_13655 [Roseomonas sp. NAR14]|uniref:Uncharacterized protein n=1 Tax=Roseomonas acroporae TaxID=2937791 RepID=A0A9X2BXX8_9PROT|nr:hypothetical protein [Roseomonas acroporae]MCK8785430.1 hypothetical protein [Roseomonas acroporae]